MSRRVYIFSREYPPVTVGGTSTVARNVAVGMATRGWEPVVVSTSPSPGPDVRERVAGVLVHRAATGVVYNSHTGLDDQTIRTHKRLFSAARQLVAELGTPDLVVLPDLFCYPEAAMFARRHRVPLLNILLQDFRAITPYDRDQHRVTSGVRASHRDLLSLEERAVRDSDHTVFISQALADAITGHYPDNESPHSVIHLGVDLDELAAIRSEPIWRHHRDQLISADHDRGQIPALLVACGRLVPVKGFEPLLRALARLGTVDTAGGGVVTPHLVLIGVGPEEQRLRDLVKDLGLGSRVRLLGDVSRREALGWMSVADVGVVPSLWESFCYVCGEMMAFARPVVATPVDSLRELIPDRTYGYPVPVSGSYGQRRLDPGDLAKALRDALGRPEEAARRGAAAAARVREHFTNDRFARRVSELGESLTRVRSHG